MTTETKTKNNIIRRWFLLCPVAHVLILVFGAFTAAYFMLRGNYTLMTAICGHFTRPWHRIAGRVCGNFGFSVCAVLIAAAVIACTAFIVLQIAAAIRKKETARRIYKIFAVLAAAVLGIYAGFCYLWGVYYYTSDFESQSGITARPISSEQLQTVTGYFAGLLNNYSAQVSRDENGCFSEDLDIIFDKSALLYENVSVEFECLGGDSTRAKPFAFSKIMSYINFTGFFFPFTGEANINVDSPACLVPATIAHEIAHQRGVAAEDEANFVAILACLENGDPAYCYSACLLAYIHLGNALYKADLDAWREVYSSLDDYVICDIRQNNEYWAQFDTPVSNVSDSVYAGFLHSYGQTLGLQSYGACVDLLTAYYYDIALKG